MKQAILSDYQSLALRTASPSHSAKGAIMVAASKQATLTPSDSVRENPAYYLSGLSLGLAGESGEVADCVKKIVAHGHPLDAEKLAKELGDVLWYLAVMADAIGYSLEDIAAQNIVKLKARYPEGFSHERSLTRED